LLSHESPPCLWARKALEPCSTPNPQTCHSEPFSKPGEETARQSPRLPGDCQPPLIPHSWGMGKKGIWGHPRPRQHPAAPQRHGGCFNPLAPHSWRMAEGRSEEYPKPPAKEALPLCMSYRETLGLTPFTMFIGSCPLNMLTTLSMVMSMMRALDSLVAPAI
jgi:hypothetical protein